MSDEWKHQVRIYLEEAQAEAVRNQSGDALPQPLAEILARHDATLSNQLQAFEDYVAEAEKVGVESFPLYRWTKATIENPEKRRKHLKAFAIVVSGEIVYAKSIADALAADLEPLAGKGPITGLSRHDTNPENNIRPPADLA
jgi:hypothetical protein